MWMWDPEGEVNKVCGNSGFLLTSTVKRKRKDVFDHERNMQYTSNVLIILLQV